MHLNNRVLFGYKIIKLYYLRTEKDCPWLAYPPKLTVELGSYVDGEAHEWAR